MKTLISGGSDKDCKLVDITEVEARLNTQESGIPKNLWVRMTFRVEDEGSNNAKLASV